MIYRAKQRQKIAAGHCHVCPYINGLRSVHWLFCSPSVTQTSCKSIDHLIQVSPKFLTRNVDQNLFCETLHPTLFILHKHVPD